MVVDEVINGCRRGDGDGVVGCSMELMSGMSILREINVLAELPHQLHQTELISMELMSDMCQPKTSSSKPKHGRTKAGGMMKPN